jgi:hypothetical protein
MVKGYPLKVSTHMTRNSLAYVAEGYSEDGDLVVDDSGNISRCNVYNFAKEIYDVGAYSMIDYGHPGVSMPVAKSENKNTDYNFSTETKDNQIF